MLLGGPVFMRVSAVSDMFGFDAIAHDPLEVLSFLKGCVAKPDRSL